MMIDTRVRLLAKAIGAVVFLLGSGCMQHQVQFRNFEAASLAGQADPGVGEATKVALRFEVVDASGKPLTHLGRHSFAIYEDGVRSTSEALAYATGEAATIEVCLLLDDSRSMYDSPGTRGAANAVISLKEAARGFLTELETNARARFRTHIYRFANSVEKIAGLDQIPDKYIERGEHFTSLYHAIAKASRSHPGAILVVFSDGADNYSQNHGTVSLEALMSELSLRHTKVHAIGFGDLAHEYDRLGVRAESALRRIARYGSVRMAGDPKLFDGIFREIARRITSIYTLTYFSPNLEGRHSLVIKVEDGLHRGSSPATFFGETPLPRDLKGKAQEASQRR
ncbi:MAG: hypothetical protein CSA62_01300 [Planctomycetota bacterium]|nr:MAG: hypothetical protein CSA62_01300 [Planctomycetota bacterium]